METIYYVVFIKDDYKNTKILTTESKALKYYNKIQNLKPQLRKVDAITGEFEIIKEIKGV